MIHLIAVIIALESNLRKELTKRYHSKFPIFTDFI